MQKFSSFGRKKKNRPKFDIEWLCLKVFNCEVARKKVFVIGLLSVCGFIAQLVEHCSANTEAMDLKPQKTFFGLLRNCLNYD